MPNHLHSLVYISEYSPDLSKLIQNAKRFQIYEIIDYLKEDNRKDLLKIFTEAAEFDKGAVVSAESRVPSDSAGLCFFR